MKFWQQFEINDLHFCTKFRGNRSHFGFRTRKPPRKFGVKSGLSQKRLKYDKPFHPNQPTFGHDEVYFSFFFPNFVRSSSPKPQNIEI